MGENRIRKPMYVKEEMGRLVKWFFGFPLTFVIYYVFSLLLPRSSSGMRMTLVLNILSYLVFLASTVLVVTAFLKFPMKKMLNQIQVPSKRNFILGFAPMLILGAGTTFLWMALSPESFSYSLQSGWPLDFALALILIVLAALLEELLCRSYIAYFVNDSMCTTTRSRLLHCLASAVVFTIFHFQNPEVGGSQAIYAMVFYFVMGFALMAITLKTGGIEAALGIHIANNLINAWLFSYDGAVLATNSVFTHHNSIGPLMVIQAVFCIAISVIVVVKGAKKA